MSSTSSQPDSRPAMDRVERTALDEGPKQDDGARHRQRQPEYDARCQSPTQQQRQADAEEGGCDDLTNRTGDRDAPDREQVTEAEVDSDAEHQQDDADLGKLGGDPRVGEQAGSEWP